MKPCVYCTPVAVNSAQPTPSKGNWPLSRRRSFYRKPSWAFMGNLLKRNIFTKNLFGLSSSNLKPSHKKYFWNETEPCSYFLFDNTLILIHWDHTVPLYSYTAIHIANYSNVAKVFFLLELIDNCLFEESRCRRRLSLVSAVAFWEGHRWILVESPILVPTHVIWRITQFLSLQLASLYKGSHHLPIMQFFLTLFKGGGGLNPFSKKLLQIFYYSKGLFGNIKLTWKTF